MTNKDVNFKVFTDQQKRIKGPAWLKINWQMKHVKPDPLNNYNIQGTEGIIYCLLILTLILNIKLCRFHSNTSKPKKK